MSPLEMSAHLPDCIRVNFNKSTRSIYGKPRMTHLLSSTKAKFYCPFSFFWFYIKAFHSKMNEKDFEDLISFLLNTAQDQNSFCDLSCMSQEAWKKQKKNTKVFESLYFFLLSKEIHSFLNYCFFAIM